VHFGIGTYGLALLAGGLSTLSPCVLPLAPILLAAASGADRRGPLALVGGLALSFALIGTALAWAGANLGLDQSVLRAGGAVLLGLLGLVLLSSRLQRHFAFAASRLSGAGSAALARLPLRGLSGQFLIGLLLGVIWSPCVGPTLGAAVTLASQAAQLPQIALLMGIFGIGAALPVVALGSISHAATAALRRKFLRAGKIGKYILGAAMLLTALSILSGADKSAETWLVDHSPAWLTELTTRY
jgi:cytochrome c-type biogenesis protein